MKSFVSLFISNFFLVGGTGLLTTFLSLYAAQKLGGVSSVGIVSICYYIGLLLGSRIAYYLISSVGHIRSYAASTALVISCVALHGISDNLYLWMLLRLVVGFAMMTNFTVLESWLNEQTAEDQRGRIFSVYMTTSYLGMLIGQFSLSYFPALDISVLFLVCFAIAAGIVPISASTRIHPKHLKPFNIKITDYIKMIPQALAAVLFAGILSGSFYSLAPVFAEKSGLNAEETAFFMTITVLAGFIAQWPMGLLSDKVHRSVLLRANLVTIFIVTLLLVLVPFEKQLSYFLTFIFGLFGFTLYPISSALANSRVDDQHRVGVSSALITFFAIGAGIGSLAIAQLMSFVGHQALYVSFAMLSLIMFLVLSTINAKQKEEQPDKADYVLSASDVTISPLAASIDPRIEESTAEEQLLVVEEQEER